MSLRISASSESRNGRSREFLRENHFERVTTPGAALFAFAVSRLTIRPASRKTYQGLKFNKNFHVKNWKETTSNLAVPDSRMPALRVDC